MGFRNWDGEVGHGILSRLGADKWFWHTLIEACLGRQVGVAALLLASSYRALKMTLQLVLKTNKQQLLRVHRILDWSYLTRNSLLLSRRAANLAGAGVLHQESSLLHYVCMCYDAADTPSSRPLEWATRHCE